MDVDTHVDRGYARSCHRVGLRCEELRWPMTRARRLATRGSGGLPGSG